MKNGELIGKGLTAEVYAWGPDKALKLYFEGFGGNWTQNEAKNGSAVHAAGVSSPAVFDIINIGRRKGIIFQRISGKTMLKRMETEPWMLYYYAQQMAEFHYKIHKCSANLLSPQKERFAYAIKDASQILGNKGKRILDYVEGLPGGESVCHGDFHFNNIIVSEKGLVAIDWTHAYKGNPLGDVARTCLTFNSPEAFAGISSEMAMMSQPVRLLAYWTYLNEYMRLAKARFRDIDAWILPVAAARLKEKIPGEQKWLMDIVDKRLEQLDK